jgi:hypothetical protein
VKYTAVNNLSYATYFSGSVTDFPALAIDATGTLTAAWRQWIATPYKDNDVQRDIFFTRCTGQGASCTPAVNLSSSLGDTLLLGGGGVQQAPAVVVDSKGKVYILYDDDTAGSTQIMMWSFQ